jgi:hypothetical protein
VRECSPQVWFVCVRLDGHLPGAGNVYPLLAYLPYGR